MLRQFKIGMFIAALGIFALNNGFATDSSAHQESSKPEKVIHLKDLLSTSPSIAGSAGQVTISTGGPQGNIHFLKAYFYGGACTGTPLGIASVIDNGAGFLFSDSQTVSLNTTAAYKLAFNQGFDPNGIVHCLALYLDGSNSTSNSIGCVQYADETCGASTCISGITQSPSWSSLNQGSPCMIRYAYVTSVAGSGAVYKCTIDSTTGDFIGACVSTGSGFTGTSSIALNNGYAYVLSGAASPYVVSKCSILTNNGALNCGPTTTVNVTIPAGIAINDGYAYITGNGSNNVELCTVNPLNGSLNCPGTLTGSNLSGPNAITINNNYAYIANGGNSKVTVCSITGSGLLDPCDAITVGVFPSALAAYNGYLYITSLGGNSIQQCAISSSDGGLTCSSPVSIDTSSSGISIMNGFAYISSSVSNSVIKCSINSITGVLDCSAGVIGSGYTSPGLSAIF